MSGPPLRSALPGPTRRSPSHSRPLPSAALPARHGILRERLAGVLDDVLSATAPRLVGYRVDVMEFVDSEHAPRNLLLRGVRTGAETSPEVVRGHRSLTTAWGVTPALARSLDADLAEVLRS